MGVINFLPPNKPIAAQERIEEIAHKALANRGYYPVHLVAVRGFFSPDQNQRKIYDDAIFLLSPNCYCGFNANVDPGAFVKHIATLKTGTWMYKLGIHGLSKPKAQQYEALVQAADVTVIRDEEGEDTGRFGINIHRGGFTKVSSLGCQTIPPQQWPSFISSVKAQLQLNNQKVIPYILTEEKV